MNLSETANGCTKNQSLQEIVSNNLDFTQISNSELDEIITLLANKLGIYASERLQEKPEQRERCTDPVSKPSQIKGLIIHQRDSLHHYSTLLSDFRCIVEQL